MNDQGNANAALTQVLQSTTNAINAINQTLLTLLPNGVYHPFSSTDAAAPTNSLYYSTDAAKLVYKDTGSVVHNLY